MQYIHTSFQAPDSLFSGKPGLRPVLERVLQVVSEVPVHCWPEKSSNQGGKDVLQSMLNEHFRQLLVEQGWDAEVASFTSRTGQPSRDRSDFGLMVDGCRLLMEVEFGNGASNERNLMKFQAAYVAGEVDLGIYLAPRLSLARRVDSGMTTYEAVCRDLTEYPSGLITCPIVVVGLDVQPGQTVDWSKSGVGNATVLSATNGSRSLLLHFIERYRAGVPLTAIQVPHEPSVLARAHAVSRKVNGHAPKRASASVGRMAEQLQLI